MDKGLKRFMRGRLRIAVVMAVCLMIVALPTFAYATSFLNASPAATVYTPPQVIGVNAFSATALDARTAVITLDGVAMKTAVIGQGSVVGHWSFTETLQGDGTYKISWQWSSDTADSTKATLWCAAPTLADGSHDVTATIGGDSTSWSFDTSTPPTPPGGGTPPGPTPTSAYCGNCHVGWESAPGMGTNCLDCHAGLDAPHGSGSPTSTPTSR